MKVETTRLAAILVTLAGFGMAADVTYLVQTVAGSDLVGDGGAAVLAQFGSAEGLAVDKAGNVYVADAVDHRVRKISPDGTITSVAGTGRPGFRGDNGPAELALLKTPYGLAVDDFGNLYIADLGNFRVRKVTPDGVIHTIAGGGQDIPSADGGDAITARLKGPRNLAVDREGNVYVSDFIDHRVYKVTSRGTIVPVAGIGVRGAAGDGGPAAWAQLSSPAGLAVDASGVLYIADSGNRLIRKVENGTISTVGVTGSLQATPTGLAVDGARNLYVALTGNRSLVVRLSANGAALSTIAGTGTAGYEGDGGPAVTAKLTDPRDVALDTAGNLYVGDARRVRMVAHGIIRTIAGDGTYAFSGDGAPAVSGHLNSPRGLAIDGWGNLFIADQGNFRIRKVSVSGVISTVAGGSPTSRLLWPTGLAADAFGNVWIGDYQGNRVTRLTPAGQSTTVAGTGRAGNSGDDGPAVSAELNAPGGMALDASGNLYIADTNNHLIRKVTPGGVISTVVGKGVRGRGGDGGPAISAQLDTPVAVAVDRFGNLYIADSYNHSIRKVANGIISTIAGTGNRGYSGDGGPATSAEMDFPSGVAVDRSGNVYIADQNNNRIRRISTDGVITTIAGTGIAGFSGDGGLALAAEFSMPSDVAVDASGNLFVADLENNRVRKLTPVTGPVVSDPIEQFRVVNSASLLPGPVAPGEIVSIYGSGFGPGAGVEGKFVGGVLENEVAGTQVLFDDRPAGLFWVQNNQINAQVPYSVAGRTFTYMKILRQGATKIEAALPVAESVPGIFTVANGTGPAVVVNADGTVNSESNPARRGSIVVLYATGEGQTSPAGVDGKAATAPYPAPVLPVSLRIGMYPAEILFCGSAPGYAGLLQINARVPAGFAPAGTLPLELTVGAIASQPGVAIFVQ